MTQVGFGPILGVLVPTGTELPKQLMIWQHVVIGKASAASLVGWVPHLKQQTLNGLHDVVCFAAEY